MSEKGGGYGICMEHCCYVSPRAEGKGFPKAAPRCKDKGAAVSSFRKHWVYSHSVRLSCGTCRCLSCAGGLRGPVRRGRGRQCFPNRTHPWTSLVCFCGASSCGWYSWDSGKCWAHRIHLDLVIPFHSSLARSTWVFQKGTESSFTQGREHLSWVIGKTGNQYMR